MHTTFIWHLFTCEGISFEKMTDFGQPENPLKIMLHKLTEAIVHKNLVSYQYHISHRALFSLLHVASEVKHVMLAE